MSGHRVEWTHDHDTIVGRFFCDVTNDEWADCRVICAGECEQWPPPDEGNRTHEVLDESGHPLGKHDMRQTDYCNYVTWMDEGAADELFVGGSDVPVRSGPVEFEWNGDGYDWRYTEEAETEVERLLTEIATLRNDPDQLGIVWLCDSGDHAACEGYACPCTCHVRRQVAAEIRAERDRLNAIHPLEPLEAVAFDTAARIAEGTP